MSAGNEFSNNSTVSVNPHWSIPIIDGWYTISGALYNYNYYYRLDNYIFT